jgi:hypothetical protein
MRSRTLIAGVLAGAAVGAQQTPNPRQQSGAMVHIFAPEQHDLYDGHFVVSANRIYMVGGLNDPEGWDHLDNEAKNVRPVAGTVAIDVDEIRNTGTFEAALKIPERNLVPAVDRWHQFSPCQNGGIVAYIHEHGTDSGCGDDNWPKMLGFLAGWGFGRATLDGKPLFQDYEMHFMVTQGLRDRKTLRVNHPMTGKKLPAGETNPAMAFIVDTAGVAAILTCDSANSNRACARRVSDEACGAFPRRRSSARAWSSDSRRSREPNPPWHDGRLRLRVGPLRWRLAPFRHSRAHVLAPGGVPQPPRAADRGPRVLPRRVA